MVPCDELFVAFDVHSLEIMLLSREMERSCSRQLGKIPVTRQKLRRGRARSGEAPIKRCGFLICLGPKSFWPRLCGLGIFGNSE